MLFLLQASELIDIFPYKKFYTTPPANITEKPCYRHPSITSMPLIDRFLIDWNEFVDVKLIFNGMINRATVLIRSTPSIDT